MSLKTTAKLKWKERKEGGMEGRKVGGRDGERERKEGVRETKEQGKQAG